MKMLNVVGLGPPGLAAREERSCFSWHTAAGGPGGTWKFVERPSSEAGLEAFVSSAMDAAVKEVSAPRDRIPSFAEAKAEFWRVQAILCARGLGGAEERRVREQLEAKSVADNFDARVHRRSVGHRPPPKLYQCFRVAAIEAKGNYDLQEKQAALFGSHVPRQCLVPPKGSVPDREDRDELDGQTLTGKAPRDLKRALGSFDPEQICAACGKWDAGGGAVALKRCANCRAIFYCSPACQKKNWKMHKKVCKQLKAEREAARVADGIGQLRV